MKKILYCLSVVPFLIAGADADPIFILIPCSGSIMGCGFNETPDPTYAISVIDSFLVNQPTATIGSYTDIISYDAHWIEPFRNGPDSLNGSRLQGLKCQQCRPDCCVGTDGVAIPVQVQVALVSSAPEPESSTMLAGALGSFLLYYAVGRGGALLRSWNKHPWRTYSRARTSA